MFLINPLHVLAACCLLGTVHAGAGANVEACVNLEKATAYNTTFAFEIGTCRCMYDTGYPATLSTASAGVSCVSVDYVEQDASCFDAIPPTGFWTLSYHSNASYFGTASATWFTNGFYNYLRTNPSVGVYACDKPEMCWQSKTVWKAGRDNSQHTIYIIFNIIDELTSVGRSGRTKEHQAVMSPERQLVQEDLR